MRVTSHIYQSVLSYLFVSKVTPRTRVVLNVYVSIISISTISTNGKEDIGPVNHDIIVDIADLKKDLIELE